MNAIKHAEALEHLVLQGPYDWHFAGRVMRNAAKALREIYAEKMALQQQLDNLKWRGA